MLGNSYVKADRYDDALEAYDQTLKLAPNWAPAVVSLAMAQSIGGKPALALTLLDGLLKAQPDHVAALWARIQVAPKQGNAALALKAYARYVEALGHRTR